LTSSCACATNSKAGRRQGGFDRARKKVKDILTGRYEQAHLQTWAWKFKKIEESYSITNMGIEI